MSDFAVIPQEAIDLLKSNPSMAAGFDRVYGAGASERVLAPKAEEPAPAQKPKDISLGERVWDATGRAVISGATNAVNELADSYEDFDEWGSRYLEERWGLPSRIQFFDVNEDGSLGAYNPRLVTYSESLGQRGFMVGEVGVKGDAPEMEVTQPVTVTGQLVSGVSQFATGYALAGSLTKLRGIVGAFTNGAIADGLAFDPKDKNITAVLEDLGVDTGSFGDIMATDPDDPDYINRLRNVADGALAGAVVEAIGWSMKALKARRIGKLSEAEKLLGKADEALAPVHEEIATGSKALVDDAQETLKLADEIFGPVESKPRVTVDGQLETDLGDVSLRDATPIDPDMVPKKLFLTPEQVEARLYQATLAANAAVEERLTDVSARSLDKYSKADDFITDLAADKVVFKDEFTKMKGGDVQRWATVSRKAARMLREMAEDMGMNPDQLIARFQSGGTLDPADLAAEIHARYRFKVSLDSEMRRMADAIAGKGFDPKSFGVETLEELKVKFFEYTQFSVNLNAGLESLTSNLGRALNAMKMVKKGDEGIKKMLANTNVFADVDAMARAISENPGVSPTKAAKDAFEAVHGFLDKVNTVRINALLSGPGTQEVNLVSSFINSYAIPSQQIVGGVVTGDAKAVRHGIKTMQGMIAGYWDAVGTALKSGWYDEAFLDPFSGKIDGDFAGRVELFGSTAVGRFLSKTVQLPSRFLMATDEFFKQSTYRGRVFADANELAIQQGLRGKQKAEFIQKYLKESYSETGAAIRADALLQAQRATFTETLDPGLASLLQRAAVENPIVRFVIPFVKTPVNILSTTWQHMPAAGITSRRLRADLAAGGARRAQAVGKQVIGTALFAMAGHLAANGAMTGSGPSDPRTREAWLKNNQPYAIRVLDENGNVNWISYARLEPMSNLLAISADAVEIMADRYNEIQGPGGKSLMGAIYMAFVENTVNKTFTQGIYDFMKMVTEADQPGGQKALNNMIASFVPNALNQLNGDDVYREARTLVDSMMARTHLYNGVDPKRNILGEPVVRTLPKWDPLGLTHRDIREIDPVMEELTKVMVANRSSISEPAKIVPGPNKIDLTQIPYKEGQSLYDRYVELVGTVKINGRTLGEAIAHEIEKPAYKLAPMGGIGITRGTKAEILRKIIKAYREKAEVDLPELREIIIAERRGAGEALQEQARQNRALFPTAPVVPSARPRRTFEDLLKE